MAYIYKPTGEIRGIIFAGVGHGGNDPGAVGYGREEDMNLIQALAAKDYWVAEGFMVVMSRNKDENDTLAEEIREANAIVGLLCAIDFHNNAGKGDGFECIHGIKSSMSGSLGLAKYIEKEVIAIGQNSRGCKTRTNSAGQDYFGFIRQVKVTSVICEGCFVDNKTDMKDFDTKAELQEYGKAVAKGTIKWLEATGKVKPKKKKSVKKKTATTEAAEKCSKTVSGTYKTTCVLNMRDGAGTKKNVLVKLPKAEEVVNFGYYTKVNGRKWLLVQATVGKTKYTGFCSSKYLKRV